MQYALKLILRTIVAMLLGILAIEVFYLTNLYLLLPEKIIVIIFVTLSGIYYIRRVQH